MNAPCRTEQTTGREQSSVESMWGDRESAGWRQASTDWLTIVIDERVKAGSQYNASAAYRHLPSTDGGIDQSSIPPSVDRHLPSLTVEQTRVLFHHLWTVDDDTKQNAAVALYCEPSLRALEFFCWDRGGRYAFLTTLLLCSPFLWCGIKNPHKILSIFWCTVYLIKLNFDMYSGGGI